MFGWELPPYNTGGLGVACYGLARGLVDQGVGISFALPRKLSATVPFMQVLDHSLQGLEVTAINSLLQSYMDRREYAALNLEVRNEFMKMYGGNLYEESMRFADMAASWSKSTPHQIVHAHDWMTYPAGMRAARMGGKPWVAHVHATEYDRTGGNVDPRIAEIEYQGLNSADQVITVSNYTKDIIGRYYAIPQDKITVVHNGVDLVDFSPADIRRVFPNDKIVLYVGRLTFQKGVDYFLESARKVLSIHPDTVFLVVGNGDMYQHLIMQAARLGISQRVIFTGFLTGDKLRAVYQMADVFVMPSVSEPYGLVALEAIASGTPVIISKQSGVSETIKNVYKVDFWDTEKIANNINAVFEHPSLASEMVSMAKKEAAQLTWEKAALKTKSVYQNLLA